MIKQIIFFNIKLWKSAVKKISLNIYFCMFNISSDLNLDIIGDYVQHLVDFGIRNAFGK